MSGNESSGQGDVAPRQSAAWIDPGAPAEELRIGDSRLVRGGANVFAFTQEPPAEVPANGAGRFVSESEVAERGLLQERVIEIGEMREEAVVSKQAVVREELVIRRDVEERTERVSATLRRTEVDVEQIEAGPEQAGAEGRGDCPAR
ncbi:MAG TPA: DUF2382 domain-containing protein [Allosphingosinicella sp.]|jgi:hypothetical protein